MIWLDRRHTADVRLALALFFPGLAGLIVYGWRTAGAALLVLLGALSAQAVLRWFRTGYLTPGRVWLTVHAGLLTLFLPATLFDLDRQAFAPEARWPSLLACGVLLNVVAGLVRRFGIVRISAVPATVLLLILIEPGLFAIDRILPPQHIIVGDLLDEHPTLRPSATAEPWIQSRDSAARVFITEPAAFRIHEFLHGRPSSKVQNETITRVVSDEIPPLEDFVIAGRAGQIGGASAIALLMGGLFLIQRRFAPFRVAAVMLLTCYATLLILPVPILVGTDGTVRTMLAAADPRVGWATGVTFVNDIFLAAPILLTAIYLGLQPGIRPNGIRAAVPFAFLLGIAMAAMTVFISVRNGPILAVVAIQFTTPTLERWLPSRSA